MSGPRSRQPRIGLPPLSGRSLDGERYEFPQDLIRPNTFLVLAFRREQQRPVDSWLPWLLDLERGRPGVGVYEVPVLSIAYGPVRRIIDGGMARGVGTDDARARTITVYTSVPRVTRALGLQGTSAIAVLLLDPGGTVLAMETGAYDDLKAHRLTAAM